MLDEDFSMLRWCGWLFAFVTASLASCTKQNPRSCADGVCNDLAFPFCDVDGTLEGEPNTCIAVSCNAGDFIACRGDQTIACNAIGNNYDVTSCENGCNAINHGCNACRPGTATCTNDAVEVCGDDGTPGTPTTCRVVCLQDPEPHCAYLEPRYLPDSCDNEVTDSFTVSTSMTLSTDIDANCTGGIVQQTGAPEICVVHSHSVVIQQGATLTAVGQRALAIVSDGDLAVTGILDISANGFSGVSANGPGGGTVVSGGTASGGNGAGGAGFRTGGGAGGSATADGGAANGGAAATNPAQLPVLVGGTIGGGPNGGGAGGAVTLIACRGTLTVDGLIDAGGGGGRGGFLSGQLAKPGSGGGAGGNVVLQGVNVLMTGQLYANGGGGGGGKPSVGTMDASTGNPGEDALRSSAQASGGAPVGQEGRGGAGGSGGNPGVGGKPNGSGTAAGGGGSSGFLQIYTPAGIDPVVTPSGLSPALQLSLTVGTR